jgi:hypothetical protein
MSKPKNMTPEQEEAWKEKERQRSQIRRKSPNYKDQEQRRRDKNREKLRAYQREYMKRRYWSNPEKGREEARRQRMKNPSVHKERCRSYKKANWSRVYAKTQEWKAMNRMKVRISQRRHYYERKESRQFFQLSAGLAEFSQFAKNRKHDNDNRTEPEDRPIH